MSYRCDICRSEILGRHAASGPRLCLMCRLSAEEVADIVDQAGASNEKHGVTVSHEYGPPNVVNLYSEWRQRSSRATP